MINTFMLASDYSLVHFVQKITEMCRGKGLLHHALHPRPISPHGLHVRKTKQIH